MEGRSFLESHVSYSVTCFPLLFRSDPRMYLECVFTCSLLWGLLFTRFQDEEGSSILCYRFSFNDSLCLLNPTLLLHVRQVVEAKEDGIA